MIVHGYVGHTVQRMGILGYVLIFVLPWLYVTLFFGLIPFRDPIVHKLASQWVFLFTSNVGFMFDIAYLYNAAFLILVDCERQFHTSFIP